MAILENLLTAVGTSDRHQPTPVETSEAFEAGGARPVPWRRAPKPAPERAVSEFPRRRSLTAFGLIAGESHPFYLQMHGRGET
jgi:hypothetical protein